MEPRRPPRAGSGGGLGRAEAGKERGAADAGVGGELLHHPLGNARRFVGVHVAEQDDVGGEDGRVAAESAQQPHPVELWSAGQQQVAETKHVSSSVLRIAAVGDLHCQKTSGGQLAPFLAPINDVADVLLLCGDLADHGLEEQARVPVYNVALPLLRTVVPGGLAARVVGV